MITKAEIEAAAVDHDKLKNDDFGAGALWMQAKIEKVIQIRMRAAWDAARYQTMNERGEFNWRFERFEDWNITPKDGAK